jgi:uncharacterized protein YfiM (DUF2279 family)
MPLIAVFLMSFIFNPASDSRPDSLKFVPKLSPVMTEPIRPVADPWFSQDKFLHFYFSATITGLGYHVYADQLKRDDVEGRALSVSLTALVGLGKELYDKKKKNQFSWKDLAWDGLGIAAGFLLFIHF